MTRWDIINYLLERFDTKRYLEIGSDKRNCFDKINALVKHDIEPHGVQSIPYSYRCSSDEAFQSMDASVIYDVMFIDGLHRFEQTLKDSNNASKHLNPFGFIVLHDCLPTAEEQTVRSDPGGPWTGDTWKAQAWLVSKFPSVWTIPDDWGCGIIWGTCGYTLPDFAAIEKEFTWQKFISDQKQILRVTEWSDFITKLQYA